MAVGPDSYRDYKNDNTGKVTNFTTNNFIYDRG